MNAEEKDLLHRHLNGDLDASEQAVFFARLQASPELRRELASHALDETLLSELVLEGRTVARPIARRRAWLPGAIAAAMLIALTLLLTLGRDASTTLRVVSVEGSAVLWRGELQRALEPGFEVRANDRIVTTRGGVVLEAMGIRVAVGADSSLSWQEGRHGGVHVERGTVHAAVPDHPALHLYSPHNCVTANAATFQMEVSVRRTRVEVEKGSITLNPDIRVAAGEYASIADKVETGRLVARAKVDEAIRRGCEFLKQRKQDLVAPMISEKRNAPPPRRTYAELALLAFHRAGYSDAVPMKAELLGLVEGRSIEATYVAALQAIALAEIDPVAHHERIRWCAQLLADSQCANGQWDYAVKAASQQVPATGRIHRLKEGPPGGDNSVTSYAVLGLLACARAGVTIDPDVIERARNWWLKCQNEDGGWGYNEAGDRTLNDADKRTLTTNASYGSMTASGVAALAALREIRPDQDKSAAAIRRGVDWLGSNFAADRTPGKAPGFLPLHWLCMAGRAGQLLASERFGAHEWYAEGAEFLLKTQHPSGAWTAEQGEFMSHEKMDVLDTCLAILFLRRETR